MAGASPQDWQNVPPDEPLPYVVPGFQMFCGEMANAIILRINNGSLIPVPVPVNQGGTGATTALLARANLGLAIGTNVQAYSAFLTTFSTLGTSGIVVNDGGTALTRSIAGGTGITITNGDALAGNPTVAINTAAALTWSADQSFGNILATGGIFLGSTGGTGALLYQPAANQARLDVGGSTYLFTSAALTLGGNAFITSATGLLKANNLSDLASATTALTNLGLSANAKSFVTAADYAAMRAAISLVPGVDIQSYSALTAAYAGAAWSAGVQIPTLTAANTVVLATVGSSAGNILNKAAGDSLYQPLDGDLTTIAGLTPTNGDFLQYTAGAWANRTAAQATATLSVMVGDSGAGGVKGLVPAPGVGDATKFLRGDGTFATPSGAGDVQGPATNSADFVPQWNGANSKTLKDGRAIGAASSTSLLDRAAGDARYLALAGGTLTGPLITVASAVGAAGFNLPPGAAPTVPNNGDLWTTAAGLYARINGATVGPFSAGGSSGDVVGPAAATNLAAAAFDGTTGKLIADSKIILTVPASAATLTLGSGKTVTISNTLTFTGTDGSTLAIGAGGTLGALSFITPGAGIATFLTTPSSANLAAAVTDETGSGALVFATSPVLVTPALGTPSALILTNATGLPISTGLTGAGAGVLTFLATPSSANLAAAVTDETGTGALVFANSPVLVTPALGTPASGTLTNCTGLPIGTGVSGLGAGVGTFLITPSSANLAAAVTDETGSGALVFGTSPTFTTKIAAASTAATIGDTTTGWGTLYLKSTGVIDFGNGNYTVTHSAGLLTTNGALSIGTGNALTCGTIELGAAADTTLSRSAAGVLAVEGVVVPTVSSTNTLSNKRITPRVTTIVSSATPAVNTDNCDAVTITALATAITSMTSSLTGTPVNFDKLTYRIKDDGTIRAIAWGASFAAMGVALPTTTVAGKVLTVGFIWDSVAGTWGCVASAQQA